MNNVEIARKNKENIKYFLKKTSEGEKNELQNINGTLEQELQSKNAEI